MKTCKHGFLIGPAGAECCYELGQPDNIQEQGMSDLIKRLRQPCHMQDCITTRHEAADALEQAQDQDKQVRKDLFEAIDESIQQCKRIEQLEAALKVYEDIVSASYGVDGYHLNGVIAPWNEFDLPALKSNEE